MSRSSWLVDGNRIATKIKSACDPEKVKWESNPTISCPKCHYIIDNNDVVQAWPGLPKGVKFDPTDQEIMLHLLAKVGFGGKTPHPFIEEFIPTVDNDDGICYTHPKNLPGVKQDGSASHFFHRAIKAYNTGTRKRRKIQGDNLGDVRWHKTGRTKPVILDGEQRGCKKIMVLYTSLARGAKADKTNWVMHQYHLGMGEVEKDGQYVISKIFYQQQQATKGDKAEEELSENIDALITPKVDPVTPMSVTPDPPRSEKKHSLDFDLGIDSIANIADDPPIQYAEFEHLEDDEVQLDPENPNLDDQPVTEIQELEHLEDDEVQLNPEKPNLDDQPVTENQVLENNGDFVEDDTTWWAGESQNLLNSQQMVEGLSLCEEFLRSQSPKRDWNGDPISDGKFPLSSQYAKLGPEDLKKDLEECQTLVLDPANIDLDTPPDFRLSQLVSSHLHTLI
ncbi:SUPPRESSOR OF GAMMA RESPONSE 1 [Linum perenne]